MGHSPYFFADRERELRDLILHADHRHLGRQLRAAACDGMDPDLFHPDDGQQPDELIIARCAGCQARLACLALALRAEEPEARAGWYGALGPQDRDEIAAALHLETPEPPAPEGAVRATQLKADGWTVGEIATALGCSRRTVQRYLRMTAA
jgi:AraC-like DNA-binding protein